MNPMGLFRTTIEFENLERRGLRSRCPIRWSTPGADLVVFAAPGDLVLLGVRSLQGLNLRVDPVRTALVPAGPVVAANAA